MDVKPPGPSLQFKIRPVEKYLLCSQQRDQDKDFLPWPLVLCGEPWPGCRPGLAFLLLLLRQLLTSRPTL